MDYTSLMNEFANKTAKNLSLKNNVFSSINYIGYLCFCLILKFYICSSFFLYERHRIFFFASSLPKLKIDNIYIGVINHLIIKIKKNMKEKKIGAWFAFSNQKLQGSFQKTLCHLMIGSAFQIIFGYLIKILSYFAGIASVEIMLYHSHILN